MDHPLHKLKLNFFDLPYDIRILVYTHVFQGRAYARLHMANRHGERQTFLCSSSVLSEEGCLFVPMMPPFRPPDMRLLLTSKAFRVEAGAVARNLWLKSFRDSAAVAELGALSTVVRTPAVELLGRLVKARMLREATVGFGEETMRALGTFVEIVPPPAYAGERAVLTDRACLTFRTFSGMRAWAAESVDELDYLFYQGVLRNVQSPMPFDTFDVAPLEHFGSLGTNGQWLIQDVWHASDPERVTVERKLRASIEWEGEA